MDDYDFDKADKEEEKTMAMCAGLIWGYDRWVDDQKYPKVASCNMPPKIELVPIGIYDGDKLLPGCHILDDSYMVYMEIEVWQ